MANLGLAGLASGVDTAAIVAQLMALERQGQSRIGYRQKAAQAKAAGLEDISTKLTALKSAAAAMRDAATWNPGQAVSSADATRVSAARTGGAPIGSYGVKVLQLSAAAQKTYTWSAPAAATTLTLDDADGATAAVTLNIAKDATISDVATAINAKSDSPVYAAVVGGNKLVMSSRLTGATANFTVTGASLSAVQKTYDWTTSAAPTTLTLDNHDGTTSQPINIPANATAADVALAITGAGGPATAAVVNGRLVLSGTANGAAGEFSLTNTDSRLALTHPIAGKDAKYTLDGDLNVYSSPTNTVTDAIPGVTLTLKGATTESVLITAGAPALDQDAIKGKIRAFVSAYNAVVTLAKGELAEKKFKNPTSDFQAGLGALYGDSGTVAMQSRLRDAMSKPFTTVGNPATLDDLTDIGISSGKVGSSVADAKSGLLKIDETVLAAAISENPQAVQRLMGTVEQPGFSQSVEALVTSISGTIDSRVATITQQAKQIGDQLTASEARVVAKEKRLTAQFAAMEKALGAAQQQQSWLTGQIASLPTFND